MQKEFSLTYHEFESPEALPPLAKVLFEAAEKARGNAYAPYSDFAVGCALQLENGEIITGSNQENAAYPSGLCAERTAVFWASSNFPDQKIVALFVVGAPKNQTNTSAVPPCGACRQALLEYEAKQDSKIELYFAAPQGKVYRVESIRTLLPFSFDASYL